MSYLEQLRKKEDFCEFEKVTRLNTLCRQTQINLIFGNNLGAVVDRFWAYFNDKFQDNANTSLNETNTDVLHSIFKLKSNM